MVAVYHGGFSSEKDGGDDVVAKLGDQYEYAVEEPTQRI